MSGQILKFFTKHDGGVYAKLLEGGIVRKHEKQKDRLRVSGNKDHAIDLSLVKDAQAEEASSLEILETGLQGEKRLFRISLDDLLTYGRKITLCGRERLRISLARFELVFGPDEPWRLEDRAEILRAETRRDEVKEIRAEQGLLFSDQEKSYWKNRMGYET